jgi:phosphotransferase system IIB component
LRWVLKDITKVKPNEIKKTSALGQIKIGSDGYQIIIGPAVEMVGNEITELLKV